MNLSKDKKRLITFCIISLVIFGCTRSQESNLIIPCKIQEITGDFYFENSTKTYTLNDMIYRNPGLLMTNNNNLIDLDKGMFFFGSNFGSSDMNFDLCTNSSFLNNTLSKVKLRQREKRLDSISNLNLETINIKNTKYKILKNITLRFLYIGKLDIPFIQNDQLINKNLPVFIILSLKKEI